MYIFKTNALMPVKPTNVYRGDYFKVQIDFYVLKL